MKHGYQILALNVPVFTGKQVGEIDILALKNNCLYVIEVKSTRRQQAVGWIKSDILTFRKYSRLKLIRTIILAMKSRSLGKNTPQILSSAGETPAQSQLQASDLNGLEDILVPKVLNQVKRVKIVLAEVILNSDIGHDIQFTHINSGYY